MYTEPLDLQVFAIGRGSGETGKVEMWPIFAYGPDFHESEGLLGLSQSCSRQKRRNVGFHAVKAAQQAIHAKFFVHMREANCLPRKIVIDKSGANTAGINEGDKMQRGFLLSDTYRNGAAEVPHEHCRTRPPLHLTVYQSDARFNHPLQPQQP